MKPEPAKLEPAKPKATKPNANTGDASTLPIVMSSPRPCMLTYQALPIKTMRMTPIQYALKLPAVRPERMFSEGPPSRDEVTTSRT